MASWTDYQSLIQLAAGLNFAYASLEVILDRPLLTISSAHAEMIEKMRETIVEGMPAKPGRSAIAHNTVRNGLDFVRGCHDWICRLNPYVSAACGVALTCMLFKAAESGDVYITGYWKWLIGMVGFLWFAAVLFCMGLLRLMIVLWIEPSLKRL